MITFSLSFVALILGYLFYGRFIAHMFGPDDRVTPAVAKADGIDFIALPNWKVFMIQFLNIAGTGPSLFSRRNPAHAGWRDVDVGRHHFCLLRHCYDAAYRQDHR